MIRSIPMVVALAVVLLGTQAYGHDEDEQGANPLGCDPVAGESCHYAVVDDFHADPSTTDSMGEVFLALNSARTEVRYLIVLDDLLGLKENPEDRTEPDDILGIHFHLHVPDTIGPHLLNIFGLATPTLWGQEDADLVVDYVHHTLTGIFDISDATIDPLTGLPYEPNSIYFASTKIIDEWIDELDNGEWVLAIHTGESGFKNFALHGHIHPVVPEPASILLFALGVFLASATRRARFVTSKPRGYPTV
jgi:hypothetical protein